MILIKLIVGLFAFLGVLILLGLGFAAFGGTGLVGAVVMVVVLLLAAVLGAAQAASKNRP